MTAQVVTKCSRGCLFTTTQVAPLILNQPFFLKSLSTRETVSREVPALRDLFLSQGDADGYFG